MLREKKKRFTQQQHQQQMVVNGYDGSIKIDIEIDRSMQSRFHMSYEICARLHCKFEHHQLSQTIYSLKHASRLCVRCVRVLFMFVMSYDLTVAHIDE